MTQCLVIALFVHVALLSSLARADLYVLGASYTSNGIALTQPSEESPNGDDLWSNGPVWVAAYAAAVGQPVPISSSLTPESGETPTNFARAGAEIINSHGGGGGITRPKSAEEQWQEGKAYIASNGPPTANDIFVTSSFGNDILNEYENSQGVVDSDFIAARVSVMKEIIDDAISIGFRKILISTLPALDRTPLLTYSSPTTREKLESQIEEFNIQLECMVRDLAGSPQLTVLWLDMAGAISEIADSPQSFGFVNNTSAIHDCNTGPDPEVVMWWDCLHPSAGLHDLLAGRVDVFAGFSGSSDFNDAADLEQWDIDYVEGSGSFLATNQRLEFLVSSPGNVGFDDYASRPWISKAACYSCDWEAVVEVTNSVTPTVTGQSAMIGLEVFNFKDFPGSLDLLSLGIYAGGDSSADERGVSVAFYVDDMVQNITDQVTSTGTIGAIRLVFNARSKALTAYYHTGGVTNGYTWLRLGGFGVAGSGGNTANGSWGMSPANTFGLYLFGNSTGIAIQSGEVYADNFSIQMPLATIPSIQIQLVNDGISLQWPASAIAYELKSSPDLSPESWTPVTQPVTVRDGISSFLIPSVGNREFFRLQR